MMGSAPAWTPGNANPPGLRSGAHLCDQCAVLLGCDRDLSRDTALLCPPSLPHVALQVRFSECKPGPVVSTLSYPRCRGCRTLSTQYLCCISPKAVPIIRTSHLLICHPCPLTGISALGSLPPLCFLLCPDDQERC